MIKKAYIMIFASLAASFMACIVAFVSIIIETDLTCRYDHIPPIIRSICLAVVIIGIISAQTFLMIWRYLYSKK